MTGQVRLLRLANGPAYVGLLRLPAPLDAVARAKHTEIVNLEDLDGLSSDPLQRRHGRQVHLPSFCGGVFFDGVGCIGSSLTVHPVMGLSEHCGKPFVRLISSWHKIISTNNISIKLTILPSSC